MLSVSLIADIEKIIKLLRKMILTSFEEAKLEAGEPKEAQRREAGLV